MEKKTLSFARESFPYIFVLIVISIVFRMLNPLLSFIPLILAAFVLFFFRDPYREIPQSKNSIVSPADGRVINIQDIYDNVFLKGKGRKISIFLSVFDVHINRSPIKGKVSFKKYVPGRFLAAYDKRASVENERNYIGIENDRLKVLVTQIAGFIARRIVCYININDTLEKGEKLGLIKFGSCTEIVLPENVEVLVNVGDKVKGGETILGRLNDEN
jgi:phosphatidylserine decarboxylase